MQDPRAKRPGNIKGASRICFRKRAWVTCDAGIVRRLPEDGTFMESKQDGKGEWGGKLGYWMPRHTIGAGLTLVTATTEERRGSPSQRLALESTGSDILAGRHNAVRGGGKGSIYGANGGRGIKSQDRRILKAAGGATGWTLIDRLWESAQTPRALAPGAARKTEDNRGSNASARCWQPRAGG